ncbi:hypothetical protein [Foetidibacter luteolus]|uniref:hypothetical protein n=1 Tax=Foetidibacter luteolus TaxID=2608880 RepID=UPI00129A54AF|nr:hypothetical protein [Foetidibacter luteolus]
MGDVLPIITNYLNQVLIGSIFFCSLHLLIFYRGKLAALKKRMISINKHEAIIILGFSLVFGVPLNQGQIYFGGKYAKTVNAKEDYLPKDSQLLRALKVNSLTYLNYNIDKNDNIEPFILLARAYNERHANEYQIKSMNYNSKIIGFLYPLAIPMLALTISTIAVRTKSYRIWNFKHTCQNVGIFLIGLGFTCLSWHLATKQKKASSMAVITHFQAICLDSLKNRTN